MSEGPHKEILLEHSLQLIAKPGMIEKPREKMLQNQGIFVIVHECIQCYMSQLVNYMGGLIRLSSSFSIFLTKFIKIWLYFRDKSTQRN